MREGLEVKNANFSHLKLSNEHQMRRYNSKEWPKISENLAENLPSKSGDKSVHFLFMPSGMVMVPIV